MTLKDQYDETTSQELLQRVQMATVAAAQAISTEADTTPNHLNRVTLANRVANSPSNLASAFTNLCCAEGITSASDDASIESMVSAVWNTMAGAPMP